MDDIKRFIVIMNSSEGSIKNIYEFGDEKAELIDTDNYEEELNKFISSRNITEDELLKSQDKGFEVYIDGTDEAKSVEEEYNNFNKVEVNSIGEEDLVKDKRFGKKGAIALGVAAATLAGGTIAGVAIHKNIKNKEKDSNKLISNANELDGVLSSEIMNNLSKDSVKRLFFEDVYSVLNTLNRRCASKKVFALDEDKKEKLVFTSDEVIAAALVLGNYSPKEYSEIFDIYTLDDTEIKGNYESFKNKLEVYAMNAKKASGVSNLIKDKTAKEQFELIENSIIKFNNNPSVKYSDLVIRYVSYFCEHGINGYSEDSVRDYSSLNAARNVALSMVTGFYDANSNYSKYLKVSSEPSSLDSKYQKNYESQVQKSELLKDIIKRAGRGICSNDSVRKQIEKLVDSINEYPKAEYFEVLFEDIKAEIDKELGPYKMGSIEVLYNNRVRAPKLINTIGGNTISSEKWNSMSEEEQREYVRDNGELISTKTETTTEKVKKEDLTPSERREAEKQEEEIRNNTDAEINATNQGAIDAAYYVNSNSYKHSTIVNPYNTEEKFSDMSLCNTAEFAYAFNNETITINDSQIQARLASDIAKFKKTTTDSKLIEIYKSSWINTTNKALSVARQMGEELRKNTKRYAELDKSKEEETTKKQETTTTTKKTEETTKEEKTTKETTTEVIYDENDPQMSKKTESSDEGYEDFIDPYEYIASEDFPEDDYDSNEEAKVLTKTFGN